MATHQNPRRSPALWTLVIALSFGACGGDVVGSQSSEPGAGGTGSGGAGSEASSGGRASGGRASGGSGGIVESSGGGGATGPQANCEPPRDEAPGVPIYALSQPGSGECEGVTLGSTIERIHAEHPELIDIQVLYAPDPERGGDGSFIYAFRKPDGTFALVFKRGGGDCPSGCTENDYWYFDTVGQCDISAAGYTRRYFDGVCLPADELPKWGIPPAAPPESICGESMAPQDLSGDHVIYLCGERSQCTTEDSKPTRLPGVVTLHIAQDPTDLAQGTVTLTGTGEPLLDGRELSATFERRRFHVEEHVSNLPATCEESHELTLDYDFEGFGAQHLSFFQVSTPDCDANPGDYCKGSLEADLGSELVAR